MPVAPAARWHLPEGRWRWSRAAPPALRPGRAGAGPGLKRGMVAFDALVAAAGRCQPEGHWQARRHVDIEPAAPVRVGHSAPSAWQTLDGAIQCDSHVHLEDPHESRRDEPWQELEGGRQHGGAHGSCSQILSPLELGRRAAAKTGRHRRAKDTALVNLKTHSSTRRS